MASVWAPIHARVKVLAKHPLAAVKVLIHARGKVSLKLAKPSATKLGALSNRNLINVNDYIYRVSP
jgi:hypothetical protein